MGHAIVLDTPHGEVGAWRADPSGTPRGGLVVVQEIFGVNAHMRSVADRFAEAGYAAIAPAFFDPVEAGVELDYEQDSFAKGRALVNALGLERAVDIVDAAAQGLRREGLTVGAVGYCWGGTVAYLANTRLGLPAVSYYGARTAALLDETLRAPMMFHFGEKDGSILAEDIAKHREKQPAAASYVYAGAGHAFNRDVDTHAYHETSAKLALERTLVFFAEHLK